MILGFIVILCGRHLNAYFKILEMNVYVDIDNTICTTATTGVDKYVLATPLPEKIAYINGLYESGHTITYWTARGGSSGIDQTDLTKCQLAEWGCKYHSLVMGKPSYDLLIDDKTMHPDAIHARVLDKKTRSEVVQKGWGHEVIFVNNDLYCGKILHFKAGARFSMHYHLKKKESWYVASGDFAFKYIDTRTADIIELALHVGDTITNEVGEPHQIICLVEGDIFEVSTTHHDTDSYRVMKGDSQRS
jgi:mannose-6-phosphate isomerase-like protein (cupin superfamily)